MKTKSGREYKSASVSSVSLCLRRGFVPLGDAAYIDSHIISVADIGESIIVVPEIDEKASNLIETIVAAFTESYESNGELPGQSLQNTATWMVAWSLEMAWCWSQDKLEDCSFTQDMSGFQVPMEKFMLGPSPWVSEVVMAFMDWCYGNQGYTERHGIDMYDPLRDGYLTIARLVATKAVPSL